MTYAEPASASGWEALTLGWMRRRALGGLAPAMDANQRNEHHFARVFADPMRRFDAGRLQQALPLGPAYARASLQGLERALTGDAAPPNLTLDHPVPGSDRSGI